MGQGEEPPFTPSRRAPWWDTPKGAQTDTVPSNRRPRPPTRSLAIQTCLRSLTLLGLCLGNVRTNAPPPQNVRPVAHTAALCWGIQSVRQDKHQCDATDSHVS